MLFFHRNHGRGGEGRVDRRRVRFFALGFIAIVGWCYVVFGSEAFKINRVEARGAQSIDEVEISREVFQLIDAQHEHFWQPKRHAWFVDREALASALKEKLFADRVDIATPYFNVLRLSIQERPQRFVFHSHQEYFWVRLNGEIQESLDKSERRSVQARLLGQRNMSDNDPPIIHRDLDESLADIQMVADSDEAHRWVDFAYSVYKAGVRYREIEPPEHQESARASILTQDGFRVWVDTVDPLQPQLDAYFTFMMNKPKGLNIQEYVDVRVPGKVFVK